FHHERVGPVGDDTALVVAAVPRDRMASLQELSRRRDQHTNDRAAGRTGPYFRRQRDRLGYLDRDRRLVGPAVAVRREDGWYAPDHEQRRRCLIEGEVALDLRPIPGSIAERLAQAVRTEGTAIHRDPKRELDAVAAVEGLALETGALGVDRRPGAVAFA